MPNGLASALQRHCLAPDDTFLLILCGHGSEGVQGAFVSSSGDRTSTYNTAFLRDMHDGSELIYSQSHLHLHRHGPEIHTCPYTPCVWTGPRCLLTCPPPPHKVHTVRWHLVAEMPRVPGAETAPRLHAFFFPVSCECEKQHNHSSLPTHTSSLEWARGGCGGWVLGKSVGSWAHSHLPRVPH